MKRRTVIYIISLLLLTGTTGNCQTINKELALLSPNGKIKVTIYIDNDTLNYSVCYNNSKELLHKNKIGLILDDGSVSKDGHEIKILDLLKKETAAFENWMNKRNETKY